jgi:hypothetical protein
LFIAYVELRVASSGAPNHQWTPSPHNAACMSFSHKSAVAVAECCCGVCDASPVAHAGSTSSSTTPSTSLLPPCCACTRPTKSAPLVLTLWASCMCLRYLVPAASPNVPQAPSPKSPHAARCMHHLYLVPRLRRPPECTHNTSVMFQLLYRCVLIISY